MLTLFCTIYEGAQVAGLGVLPDVTSLLPAQTPGKEKIDSSVEALPIMDTLVGPPLQPQLGVHLEAVTNKLLTSLPPKR